MNPILTAVCMATVSMAVVGPSHAAKIILVHDNFPGSSEGFYATLRQGVKDAGFEIEEIEGEGLADRLASEKGPGTILVLPNSRYFPADAKSSLDGFLKRKNHLFTISGPAFKELVVSENGKWLTRELARDSLAESKTTDIIDFSKQILTEWEHASDIPEGTEYGVEDSGDPRVPAALKVSIKKFSEYDVLKSPPLTAPFPAGASATVFWAKGDVNTPEVVVEWREKDGMRWLSVVKLTTEWKRYVLTPVDFRPWNDLLLPNRGGAEDKLNTSNVDRIAFNLMNGFSSQEKGMPHTYWISDIRSTVDKYASVDFLPPIIESISPFYKTYSVPARNIAKWKGEMTDLPKADIVSPFQRMRGLGADEVRKWRFIPVIQAVGEQGEPRGTAAHLFLNTNTAYSSSMFGYVGFSQEYLETNSTATTKLIVSMLRRMDSGMFITNGGTDRFAYSPDDHVRCSAYLTNLTSNPVNTEIRATISKRGKVMHSLSVSSQIPGQTEKPTHVELGDIALPQGEYTISTSMYVDGHKIDRIEHPFQVIEYTAIDNKDIVRLQDSDFYLGGRKWYPLGLNYWPRYVSGCENGEDALFWLHPWNYDPETVEADLRLAEKLKMNVFSIAYYGVEQAAPLMDFMARAQRHGIKVHVFVPYLFITDLNLPKAVEMIRAAHLPESPAFFAYDLGWEVHIGNYDARRRFDDRWQNWVIDQYGSIDGAEKSWGFVPERVDGVITGPKDTQLTNDGDWRIYVAAYRRFWDDEISKHYRTVREHIRMVDRDHLLGARSGWAGTGSLWAVPGFPLDLASGAKHLDFTSPEAYNVGGDLKGFMKGGLNTAYGRFVSGNKPVVWIEYAPAVAVGLSPWTFQGYTAEMLEQQRAYYHSMIEMTYRSEASGSAGWWWPGGLRLGENSDLGVINPDGTPRPSALEIEKAAPRFTKPRDVPKPDQFLIYDRDVHVAGYAGFYESHCAEYAEATVGGKVVGVKTEGTGTNSANTPLIAVGNTPYTGSSPLKYLNAEFNRLYVNGMLAMNGGTITVDRNKPVYANVSIGNTAEATWLLPSTDGTGAVYLQAESSIGRTMGSISRETPFLQDATVTEMRLADKIEAPTMFTFRMIAKDRAAFGEVFRVTVKPR